VKRKFEVKLTMLRGLITIGLIIALLCSCATHQAPAETKSVPNQTSLGESDLDRALQRVASESLGEREGTVIIIDPQNGRLRAIVNPRLAFEQAFPPGSAIKPFTALAAMRAGLIGSEYRHQCRTRYARGDFEIVCSHPVSKSPFNLAQALAYSCNNYFARVGERLSEGSFNSTLSSFGFGYKTGVNAAESMGNLPRGDWQVRDALGESDRLLVTPIQLITAYAALVNGGHLYQPQRSTDHDLVPQEKMRLMITPAHRDVLIEGMRGSVKYGTAAKAMLSELPFYVFGKTGTSTASNNWRTQGWFVGFAAEKSPLGSPRPDQIKIGVLVFLKRAHGSQCAEVAKPILDCGLQKSGGVGEWESGGVGERESGRVGERESGRGREGGTRGQGDKEKSAIRNPQSAIEESAIRNPQSAIRVHSVSENITRELPVEEYLAGVLLGEASIESEIEALKAQAVISRTFALKNRNRHAQEGFDYCSTTHCQRFVMPKANQKTAARRAVEQTAGEILRDQSRQIVDAYFHAACGGVTANIETLWGVTAPTYLLGVRDDFCATMPHRRWIQTIRSDQLGKALQSDERTNAGARLDSITVSKRDATGRAEMITIAGSRRRVVRGWDFKIIVGRALGWHMIKSSRFDVARAGNDFVFRGSGFGHGLGLCQEGAHVAARRGMNYRQILNHYFPGTRLIVLSPNQHSKTGVGGGESRIPPTGVGGSFRPSPQTGISLQESPRRKSGDRSIPTYSANVGAKESPRRESGDRSGPAFLSLESDLLTKPCRLGLNNPPTAVGGIQTKPEFIKTLSSEHFRVSFPSNVDPGSVEKVLRVLETARDDLLRRLKKASLRIAEPAPFEVVIHSTTSSFIKATGQSGWAAGATRGRRIELQPIKLLQRRGILTTTLRHELAHAVIEALSQGRGPRWMVEGMAIHVAGEGALLMRIEIKIRLSREEIERRLARTATVAEMRELYAMAYREVYAMIQSEGEPGIWRRLAKFKETSKKA
jgi:stage II sporulation protein D